MNQQYTQSTESDDTLPLPDLILKAQGLRKEKLQKNGNGEAVKGLPWKYEAIEKTINENSFHDKDENSKTIISAYTNIIDQTEEISIVREIAEQIDFVEATVRNHLKLYGLVPENGDKGGKRHSLNGAIGTTYTSEQMIMIIGSFYDDYFFDGYMGGIANRAAEVIKRRWNWVEKTSPTFTTVKRIWDSVKLRKDMENPPTLDEIIEKYNLMEV